jgi:hypothetical protein
MRLSANVINRTSPSANQKEYNISKQTFEDVNDIYDEI